MPTQCLIAEYASFDDAKVALEVLATDHFTEDDVSMVTRSDDPAMQEIRQLEDRHSGSPSSAKAAGVGSLVGGSVMAPIATSSLIGPFLVAGPLAGIALGAAGGALLASTDRWGVDHDVAHDYEHRVKNGSVLVFVHHEDPIRIDDAERLLKTCDHSDLQRYTTE